MNPLLELLSGSIIIGIAFYFAYFKKYK